MDLFAFLRYVDVNRTNKIKLTNFVKWMNKIINTTSYPTDLDVEMRKFK